MKDNRWAMLCKLRVAAFDDDGWTWERKHDGFRLKARIVDPTQEDGPPITLTARSGADKTAVFPEIVQALALTVDWGRCPMTLDGEVINANGLGFQDGIQPRVNRELDIEEAVRRLPAKYLTFDMMEGWGEDLEGHPLKSRLNMLHTSRPSGTLAPESSRTGTALWMTAEANGWEGVVGKRLDEPYMPHRRAWVKVKRWQHAVFYVVGFLWGTGKRADKVGSLYLVNGDGEHVGNVGTGLDDAMIDGMTARLRADIRNEVKGVVDIGHPFPVCIKFQEYTNDSMLRFPVYEGEDTSQEPPDAK